MKRVPRGPMTPVVVDAAELERRQRRAAKFAADAAKPPPPLPKRRFAWDGGAITSNKAHAAARFLRRDNLNPDQRKALLALTRN